MQAAKTPDLSLLRYLRCCSGTGPVLFVAYSGSADRESGNIARVDNVYCRAKKPQPHLQNCPLGTFYGAGKVSFKGFAIKSLLSREIACGPNCVWYLLVSAFIFTKGPMNGIWRKNYYFRGLEVF